MKFIAKFNHIVNWEGYNNDKIPLHKKHEELAKLVHKKGTNGGIYLGPKEGFHRQMARVLFSLAAKLDQHYGRLIAGSLKMRHFAEAGILSIESPPEDTNLVEIIENIIMKQEPNKMHNKNIFTKADYVSNSMANAADISRHNITISKTISESKLNSSILGAGHRLKRIVVEFMERFQYNNLLYRADFSKMIVPDKSVMEANKVTKEYNKKGCDEMKAFPYSEIVDSPAYQYYMLMPLDLQATEMAVDALAAPILTGKYQINGGKKVKKDPIPTKLTPPFATTYDALAVDVGKEFNKKARMNPDIANGFYLAPKIIVVLYAANFWMTVTKASQEPKCLSMILYYVKFHCNARCKANNLVLHGAYTVIHNCGQEKHMTQSIAQILGATNFIIEIINAVISRALDDKTTTMEQRGKRIRNATTLLGSAFTTMTVKEQKYTDGNMIALLGKPSLSCDIFS